MSSGSGNARNRLRATVHYLATLPGPIADRLVWAATQEFIYISEGDLREGPFRERWQSIYTRLNRSQEPYGEHKSGTVAYTVGETPEADLERLAEDIWDLHQDLLDEGP